MHHTIHQGEETALVFGLAGSESYRPDGSTVECPQETNELAAAGVEARQFDGGFDALCA